MRVKKRMKILIALNKIEGQISKKENYDKGLRLKAPFLLEKNMTKVKPKISKA